MNKSDYQALHTSATAAATSSSVPCEDCDGRGEVGEAYGGSAFQPPEHDRCDSCGGSGRWEIAAAAACLSKSAESAPQAGLSLTGATQATAAAPTVPDSGDTSGLIFYADPDAIRGFERGDSGWMTVHSCRVGGFTAPVYVGAPPAAAPTDASDREEQADMTALQDMLDDARTQLDMLREALDVSVEPHQSLFERILEKARALASSPAVPPVAPVDEREAFIQWRKDTFLNPPKWDEKRKRFIDPIDHHGYEGWLARAALKGNAS